MNFFDQTGKMAIGSRLRMLPDVLTEDADQVYGFLEFTQIYCNILSEKSVRNIFIFD